MNACDIVVSNQEIIKETLLELANAQINVITVEKKIRLLSVFVRKVNVKEYQSSEDEQWLDDVMFKVCFQYYKKLNNKSLKTVGSLLLQSCCQKETLKVKGLFTCLDMLKDAVAKITSDSSHQEVLLDTLYLTLNFIKISEVGELKNQSIQKDIFTLCIQLLHIELISDIEMVVIVELMNKVFDSTDVTQSKKIWSCVMNLSEKKEDKKLFTLLAIELPILALSNVISKENFWSIVQEGLLHVDPLTRKRALFILKWSIDFISKEEHFSTDCAQDALPVMIWNKEKHLELWNMWKNIMLILESFEEKQLHVIQPVLSIFDDICDAGSLKENSESTLIHFSWLLVLLRRAMIHESKPLIKWAMHYCLQMDLKTFPLLLEHDWKFIFVHLMQSLQSSFIYVADENSSVGSPPIILKLLTTFLSCCFNVLTSDKELCFCNQLLHVVTASSFNDISLVYITKAISTLSCSTIPCQAIAMFKNFLFSSLPSFKMNYQIVIFQNLSMFLTVNAPLEDHVFVEFISIISHAQKSNLILVGDKCWIVWLRWFKKYNTENTCLHMEDILQEYLNLYLNLAQNYTSSNVNDVITLIMLQLHTSNESIEGLFLDVTNIIRKLNSSPYLGVTKIFKVLCLIRGLLNVITKSSFDVMENMKSLMQLLFGYSSSIFDYVQKCFKEVPSCNELCEDIIEQCFGLINLFTDLVSSGSEDMLKLKQSIDNLYFHLKSEITSRLRNLVTKHSSRTNLLLSNLLYDLITVKCAVFLLNWFGQKVCDIPDFSNLLIQFALIFNRQYIHSMCKKQTSKLKLATSDVFIKDSWLCLDLIISNGFVVQNKVEMLEEFFGDVNLVSFEKIPILVRFSRHFVDLFEDDISQLLKLIDFTWRIIKEQTRADHSFWEVYKRCVEVIFHSKLLLSKHENVQLKLKNVWHRMIEIGAKKSYIVNILIEQCVNVWSNCIENHDCEKSMLQFTDCLLPVCVYGPLHRKHERPFNDLIMYLQLSNEYDGIESLISFHSQDQNVRVALINFILKIKDHAKEFIINLLLSLLTFEKSISWQGQCYYPNSEIHRHKVRVWQMILILLGFLPRSYHAGSILDQLYATFKTDNQPSIRYFIEWCILVLFIRDHDLVETVWLKFNDATEKKILTVTSILSLCIQLTKYLNDAAFRTFTYAAIPRLLPWSQAQHMATRIHAQVGLQAIWDNIGACQMEELKKHFSWLQYCFTLKEHNTAAVRFRTDLLAKCIYSKFHPVKHYSLQSIFHGFLTLAEVMRDECIMLSSFSYEQDNPQNQSPIELKLCDEGELLEGEPISSDLMEVRTSDKQLIDMQKKIMPWRVLPPSDDIALLSEFEKKKDSKVSELVLCAVLVDKIPNLGGLCRTAEIFGVGTLTLASRQYINDKNFKSLSVSAEKWVQIEQVLPIKFASYLQQMKNEGYHLVGVEQTANSKMIGDYKFPKKTVLILGNEKTGIPVDIIQLLDDCVEIPQIGIIRSLNVHISGAIMVWEYCKQHML